MTDNARARVLLSLGALIERMGEASREASVAYGAMETAGEYIRHCIEDTSRLGTANILDCKSVFDSVPGILEQAGGRCNYASDTYLTAAEKVKAALTDATRLTESSDHPAVASALASMALAQQSWEGSSQECALAGEQTLEALRAPQLEVQTKLEEVAGTIIASENNHAAAQAAVTRMIASVGEYADSV